VDICGAPLLDLDLDVLAVVVVGWGADLRTLGFFPATVLPAMGPWEFRSMLGM